MNILKQLLVGIALILIFVPALAEMDLREKFLKEKERVTREAPEPQRPPQRPSSNNTETKTEANSDPKYEALYDYAAADSDEVSFNEGDIIIDVEPIDVGWVFGTVERTNKRGLLPDNYIELR